MKTLTVKIEQLGSQGDGIAVHEDERLLVPHTLPQETVKIELTPAKGKKPQTLRVVEITDTSPIRTTPPCPHFGICGGCKLQHMQTEAYQAWKADTVTSFLEKQGLTPKTLLAPIFVPPHTRRRVSFAAIKHGRKTTLGFNMAKSHTVFMVESCQLLTPELEALHSRLPALLNPILTDTKQADIFLQQADNGIELVITGAIGQRGKPDLSVHESLPALLDGTGIIRICWRANEKSAIEVMLEQAAPEIEISGAKVKLPPQAFLQPSVAGQQALQNAVTRALASNHGAKGNTGHIADLFCGVGTFSLPAADYGVVSALEGEDKAIAALDHAARMHQKQVQPEQRDLFRYPLTVNELDKFDSVILDPPRAGARQQIELLAQSSVKQIIYVSCNPGTFSRDAVELVQSGYSMESLQVVDQFVWSAHAELVAVFKK